MMDSGGDRDHSLAASTNDALKVERRIATLVLGDLQYWLSRGRDLPRLKGFQFADVDALGPDLLEVARPGIILSPLQVRDKDAFDIARDLAQLDFKGSYRVLAQGLPKPELVRQDIRSVAPWLDFAIINLPNKGDMGFEEMRPKPN